MSVCFISRDRFSNTVSRYKHKGEYPFYKVGDIANNAIAGKIYLELCNRLYFCRCGIRMIKGCILPKDTDGVIAKIGEALKT